MPDQIRRFHFTRAPVRGLWVRLNEVIESAINGRPYNELTEALLGKLLASVVLISNSIKHEEAVSIHVVGNGFVKTAFVECTHQECLRGIVRPNEDIATSFSETMSFKELIGEAQVALTLQLKSGDKYQGRVAVEHDELEANLEHYFATSEQVPTLLLITANRFEVTGCLLQRLPSEASSSDVQLSVDESEWMRVQSLFRTLSEAELATQSLNEILTRVFRQDSIYVDDPSNLRFECTCSRDRCYAAIQTLPESERLELYSASEPISVQCEFCGTNYNFNPSEPISPRS